MNRTKTAPQELPLPVGRRDHNGCLPATVACDCTGIFHDDASLKEAIVEALSELQSEDFALAAAVSMDVVDDWPGFREA